MLVGVRYSNSVVYSLSVHSSTWSVVNRVGILVHTLLSLMVDICQLAPAFGKKIRS